MDHWIWLSYCRRLPVRYSISSSVSLMALLTAVSLEGMQLITNLLGIRILADGVELQPVLPSKLEGMTAELCLFEQPVQFVYHFGADAFRAEKDGNVVSDGNKISKEHCCGIVHVYLP